MVYMEKIIQNILYIGSGIPVTMGLLLGGIVIGFICGALFAILRHVGIGQSIIRGFVSIVRGTPVILQLSLVYFAFPTILGIKFNWFIAGIVTFGMNSSAYVAEIARSGMESIPKGRFEAAKTLRIPTFWAWKDIILPQVVKNVFPAAINETIALLKETALVSVIGGMDIMRKSQSIAAEQFEYFMPLCIAGGYYYLFVLLMEFVGKKVEKRLNHAENS